MYQEVLSHVFKALQDHHIFLEGLLLEINFIRAGQTHCHQSTIEENARTTLEVLQRTVPTAVPGVYIAFVSYTSLAKCYKYTNDLTISTIHSEN